MARYIISANGERCLLVREEAGLHVIVLFIKIYSHGFLDHLNRKAMSPSLR